MKCPVSATPRWKDMVFTLQPVFHTYLIMRDARFLEHLKEVILLLTAISAIKNPIKIEERKTTSPVVLPG